MMRILLVKAYMLTRAETSTWSCTRASAYNFDASSMNCLYSSCRLLLSCKSHWTFACWRWVTQATLDAIDLLEGVGEEQRAIIPKRFQRTAGSTPRFQQVALRPRPSTIGWASGVFWCQSLWAP